MADNEDTRISLKFRSPTGTHHLQGISAKTTITEFQALVHQTTNIEPAQQVFKRGFPPQEIQLPEERTRSEIRQFLHDGELFIVAKRQIEIHQETASVPPIAGQSGIFPLIPSSAEDASEQTSMSIDGGDGGHLTTSLSNQDEELDRAIAMSLHEMEQTLPASNASEEFEPGPILSDRAPDGTFIIRRFVDSDNSCLFTAVAYLVDGNRLKGFDLRGVIATIVGSDPVRYNEAFLGRPNHEYCQWITNPQHWGGEIELLILSQYFSKQIAVYDIQTTNCYVYGIDAGFTTRVMLVYDGIHYDALARTQSLDSPEAYDMREYDPSTAEGIMITNAAIGLVQKFNATHQYTNTASFQLRCSECGRGFSGRAAAEEHCRVTSHSNFSEYK